MRGTRYKRIKSKRYKEEEVDKDGEAFLEVLIENREDVGSCKETEEADLDGKSNKKVDKKRERKQGVGEEEGVEP